MVKLSNVEVAVVMIPLPTQGHLNQLLHLSRLISAYHLPLHFTGTTTHLRQAKNRVQGWDPLSTSNVKFHEFSIPSYETPPPNPNSTTKFPSHLMPSLLATCHLRHPISSLLHELSRNYKRVIVIYDSLIAWVLQDAPSIPNVECYSFRSISGFTIYSFICDAAGRLPADAENEFLEKISSMEGCFTSEFAEFSRVQTEFREMVNSGDLYNSCYEIEGFYLDLLAKEKSAGNKQWAVGPLNPPKLFDKRDSRKPHKCIKWLDEQEPNSVIFASFGTTTTLSDEEIKELAIGLEKSEKKFIWVLREADKGDIFTGKVEKLSYQKGMKKKWRKEG